MDKFNLIEVETFKETNLKELANKVVNEIELGNNNPLPVYIQAKALSYLSGEIIKKVKHSALDEAETYSKNDSIFNGAKFMTKNTGDILNYSDDDEYRELEKKLKAREDKLKRAFDMSKNGEKMVDDSGELIQVVSIKKNSEQTLNISFK